MLTTLHSVSTSVPCLRGWLSNTLVFMSLKPMAISEIDHDSMIFRMSPSSLITPLALFEYTQVHCPAFYTRQWCPGQRWETWKCWDGWLRPSALCSATSSQSLTMSPTTHNFKNHWVNSAAFIGSEGCCHLVQARLRNCYPAYGISTQRRALRENKHCRTICRTPAHFEYGMHF